MAVTFVGVSAETTVNATIPVPAGSANDLLILFWESDTSTDSAAASGWTGTKSTYGSHAFGFLWNIDATTGGGSQTFTGLTTGLFTDAFIVRYSGTHQTTPINASNLDVLTHTASSITTTVNGCMEVVADTDDGGIGSTAPPSGWTRRLDGSNNNFYAGERAQATAGATGTSAWPGASNNGLIHLAIAPPSSGAEVGYDVSRSLPRGMIPPTGFLRDTYSYIETLPVVTTPAQPWAQILVTPEPVVVPLLAQILPGLDPRVVETVPVPQLLRLLNIAQPLTAATIVGGQDPSIAETVRISLLVQALNIVQPPTRGVVVGGWDPTALRTVVLSPVVRADAPRITPYPNQVFVALQVGNAPPVTGVFYVGLIQANAVVIPLQQAAVAVGEYPPLVSTVPVVPYTRGVPWAVPGASSLILPGLHPNLVETVPVIPLTYGLARSIATQQLTLRTGITIGIPPPIFGLIPTVYGTAVVVRRSDGVVLLGLQAGNAPPLDPYLLENFTTIFSTNDTVLTLSDSGLVVVSYTDPTTLTVFGQTAEYDHVDDQGGTRD